jgi:hypothetical protein
LLRASEKSTPLRLLDIVQPLSWSQPHPLHPQAPNAKRSIRSHNSKQALRVSRSNQFDRYFAKICLNAPATPLRWNDRDVRRLSDNVLSVETRIDARAGNDQTDPNDENKTRARRLNALADAELVA